MVYLWMALGVFIFPLFLLIIALGSTDSLVRADLICVTIVRTILPYIAMWLTLIVVYLVKIVPAVGTLLMQLGVQITLPTMPEFGWVGVVAIQVVNVYMALVAMRIIGVYYLHFHRRFALVIE
jgi:hypothetical protein